MAEKSSLEQNSIPKFTSFRPKPSQADPRNNTEEDGKKFSNAKQYRSSRRTHSSGGRRSEHKRRKSSSEDPRLSSEHHEKHEIQHLIVKPWDDEPDLFTVDKIGDENNVAYGSLHHYSVPLYYRAGSGRIIGLDPDQYINHETSTEKFVVTTDRNELRPLRRDKRVLAKILGGKETRIKPLAAAIKSTNDNDADFLPLANHQSGSRRHLQYHQSSKSSSDSEDENLHYRSIRGKAKPVNTPEDPDLEYKTSSSASEGTSGLSRNNEVFSRKMELSKRVEVDQKNGEAWLALIEHQDQMTLRYSAKQTLTAAERLSNADIKLSMYERALSVVKDQHYKELLLLGMIEEGAKVWESRKLASKWQSVLQDNPHHVVLWTKHLDFEQTNSSTFRYDEARATFTKCLDILRAVPIKGDNLPEIQIYLLLRCTLFMREAGFPEQSIAIWQAILEFNCRGPPMYVEREPKHDLRFRSMFEDFEDFWESEVPRIGEENSQGWVAYNANHGQLPQPKMDAPLPQGSSRSILETWSDHEQGKSLEGRHPARTIDETGEDDPYRVVLFADVKDFLLPIAFVERPKLIYAFLAYCGLPPPENTPNRCIVWWKDPFIRNASFHGYDWLLSPPTSLLLGYDAGQESLSDPTSSRDFISSFPCTPVSLYITSTDTLFAKVGSWFSVFDEWIAACKTNQGPVITDWVCRTLKILVDTEAGGDDLAEYFLSLEFKLRPITAKKTTKSLLKKRPSNLRLYNAYALIEYRLGNRSAAEAVLYAAINMSKSLDIDTRNETILLWRTWVWELMQSSSPEEALERLLTLGDDEISPDRPKVKASPATVLRTQMTLKHGRDHAFSLGDYRRTILHCECLILLSYLTNPLSIDVALSCFKAQTTLLSSRLPPASQHHQLLHQSFAKLLHYHTTHAPSFKPALIRSTLTESITLFPQNTIFLSLYAQNETRFRIDDRVRSIVNDVVLSTHSDRKSLVSESITSHLFAIYAELTRNPTLGSNNNSIRGTFERALASPCGGHSVALWKLYFRFEHARGEMQRANGVFYRGVRACPWAKELYMLPFRYLRGVVGWEELKGVYGMMVEKELRIFVPLDEVFEELEAEAEAEAKAKGKGKGRG